MLFYAHLNIHWHTVSLNFFMKCSAMSCRSIAMVYYKLLLVQHELSACVCVCFRSTGLPLKQLLKEPWIPQEVKGHRCLRTVGQSQNWSACLNLICPLHENLSFIVFCFRIGSVRVVFAHHNDWSMRVCQQNFLDHNLKHPILKNNPACS